MTQGMRHVDADGFELTVIPHELELTFVIGRPKRGGMRSYGMSDRSARALLWFLLKWWVCTAFGLLNWRARRRLRQKPKTHA